MNTVSIGNVNYENGSFPLIAGPCVIESRDHSLKMAEQIQKITNTLNIPLIFKSSFDKANRSSVGSFRGPDNLEVGLSILADIKKELGVPVLTDVHLPVQCSVVAEVCDVLQIPAFLCRQTDLLLAAGETGKAINIKKGQLQVHRHNYLENQCVRWTKSSRDLIRCQPQKSQTKYILDETRHREYQNASVAHFTH